MLLTMKDIINLDIMKNSTVRTRTEHLEERVVEWVSVTEAPVENFVRKNEFVLTTGMGCGHDPLLFREFVEDVIKSQASGLAIATGRYTFDIFHDCLQLAEENQFPIIELPWEVRFADITQAVMKKITEMQQQELENSQQTQQQLLNMILQGSDLSDVCKFVSRKISFPVLITNKFGNIKGNGNNSRGIIEGWVKLVEQGIVPDISHAADNTRDPFQTKIQRISTMTGAVVLQLPIIQTTNKIRGYLFVLVDKENLVEKCLTHSNLMVMEHAVTVAALWFLRESAVEETELRLRDDFIWNLAIGQVGSWNTVLSRSKSLGYDLSLFYICIVGLPENLESLYKKSTVDNSYSNWLHSMIHYIEEEAYYTAESLQRKTLLTYQEGKIVVFLEVQPETHKETVSNFLNLIDRRLSNLLPGVVMSWGIGRLHEGEMRFHESYEDAKVALDIGKRKKGSGQRVSYSETRVDRILIKLSENKELREITLATISPLVEYDKQRNMDLIQTFITYHQYQTKVSQTARVLNLHRQSLLYRLRKIEALTGLSLANPDDVFLLDLSVKIWKIGIENKFN